MTTLDQETQYLAVATALLAIEQAKPAPEFDDAILMLRLLVGGSDWQLAEAMAHDLARRFRVKRLEAACDEAGIVKNGNGDTTNKTFQQ